MWFGGKLRLMNVNKVLHILAPAYLKCADLPGPVSELSHLFVMTLQFGRQEHNLENRHLL